ncbi:MAG: peptide ABC transporter ATP-binding protein [Rhodospirillaceae bacterium]|jgi:oligopeptide/dipeptide ABC transporter ATP-binding protein|nr:peptide ABC transporter ATP-binding protein [Rhodospirillaceae bacterium]MDP6674792.1 ABC transporter ATP-binding protein [Gammaproteobacteria bacterium]|tara:strand:+ start:1579 stop:2556 length:978 start_codon:yes stop_codon:yes gene_type:complete
MNDPILEIKNLNTCFDNGYSRIHAVNNVSFNVQRGEILGIVGESGSGKSVACLSVLRLVPRGGRIVGGEIIFDGEDLMKKSKREMRKYRGCRISMVLQNPLTSLNPVIRIGDQVSESLLLHSKEKRGRVMSKVVDLLKAVKIPSADMQVSQYPHQLSGGMRQRVVTSIAIGCEPELLIADESTTALDVTIQAQVLQLLRDLRRERGLSIILVTHNLGIVAGMCDRVIVMYAGQLLEIAATEELFANPCHPYTKGLLRSVPRLTNGKKRLISIPGQPPDMSRVPEGCPFWPRCEQSMDICKSENPPVSTAGSGHEVKCWLYAHETR